LAALHQAGLLHRDIKAQNVMREQGGRTVLMDLGAGREIIAARDSQDATVTGTPFYMAPELLAGDIGSVQSDLYGLGVLLFYAVTGTYPIDAQTLDELSRKHARGERRHLRDLRPDLPAGFVAVIERATAPTPGDRFGSVGEMEKALSQAVGFEDGGYAQSGSHAERRPKSARRTGTSRGMLLAVLLGVMAIAAVLFFLWPGFLIGSSYTVNATLHRVRAGISEQLLPGARVSPGDRLHLEFEASRDMHVYVLAEDDRGAAFVLHPLPGSQPANPLTGSRAHRLPPDRNGQPFSWGVSSVGGTEHLLIIASPEALGDLEQTLAVLPVPREVGDQMEDPTALPLDRDALSQLRGIGLLLKTEPAADPAAMHSAFAMARRLAAGPERGRGVWVRQIDLINPGP
jgi:hypothetical protein